MTDNEANAAFLASLDREPGLFRQMQALVRGPIGRLTLLVYLIAIVTAGVTIWTVMRMFAATDARSLILWSTAAWACWTSIITMKLWIWNRLNTLAVLRALHRLKAD